MLLTKNMDDCKRANAVYSEFFAVDPPARVRANACERALIRVWFPWATPCPVPPTRPHASPWIAL